MSGPPYWIRLVGAKLGKDETERDLADMCSAPEALVHDFFDELRVEGARLPNGKEMPALFDFTREGEWLYSRGSCCSDMGPC